MINFWIKFSRLVGEKGRGSREKQITEIMNIAQAIQLHLYLEEAEMIGDQLFGGTNTFRKGEIGRWKEVFLPYQKEVYKERYGQLLIDLGYEKDLNW